MKRSVAPPSESAKKFKKGNLLLHQNSELALALKLAKQEIQTLNTASRRTNDRLTSQLSSLDRAWKALNARLLLIAQERNSSLPASSATATIAHGSVSKYVLANVNENDEEGDDDDGDEDMETTEDDFQRELGRRMEDTLSLFQSNASLTTSRIAPVETLAARVELLKDKLGKSRKQLDLVTTQLEEERTNSWRLMRRLEHAQHEQQQQQQPVVSQQQQSSAPAPPPPPPSLPPPVLRENEHALQAMTELAESRLAEIKQLEERHRAALLAHQEALKALSHNESSSSAAADATTPGKLLELEQRELKTGRLAELALEKLGACEQVVQDLSRASLAISAAQESQLRKENVQLKTEVTQLKHALATQQALKSRAIADEELITTLRAEKQALQSKLTSNRLINGSNAAVVDEDGLITEIENLNQALNLSRDETAKLQRECEQTFSKLSEEKYLLEKHLREVQEEKNMHALRSDRAQQLLAENEHYLEELQAQVQRERQVAERAEELVKRTVEACERAVIKEGEARRVMELFAARQAGLVESELSLTKAKLAEEESRFELHRANEEIAQLRRRLERAKAMAQYHQQEAEAAAAAGGGAAASSASKDAQDLRLQAMSNALRCPVYPHLWKDCVITKCAHMFSRKCLEDNLANRNRRCPTCKNQYSKDDILTLYLYQSN